MAATSEVAILGGGAAGCAVAYFLAKAGIKSIIIEREGVASQASGYAAGGLYPLRGIGTSDPLGPMAIESFQMHLALGDQLRTESSVDFQLQPISSVIVAFNDSDLPALEKTVNTYQATDGFSSHWLDSDGVKKLEPRLAPGIIQGIYTQGDRALVSYHYTLALAKAAESFGATIVHGTVRDLKIAGSRVTSVLLDNGEVACDWTVVATGPWAREAERWLRVPIPIQPLKGETLRMELEAKTLSHDLIWDHISLYHRPDGLVWLGDLEQERGFDTHPSESGRRSLLQGAIKLMPAIAEAKLVKHTACLRPLTPDWLPIIGKAPGWENVYLATGGGKKGILISPGTGKAIADLITQGTTNLPIGPFTPERFAGDDFAI